MTYTCLHCHKSFDKRKGLTVHQGKCPKRGHVRLRGPFTASTIHASVRPDSDASRVVQTSSDPSTSHTPVVTGPNLQVPILQVDNLRVGIEFGLPSHPATPGASTDDGPDLPELSTGGPSLPEPLRERMEPEAGVLVSLDLSQLRDPPRG